MSIERGLDLIYLQMWTNRCHGRRTLQSFQTLGVSEGGSEKGFFPKFGLFVTFEFFKIFLIPVYMIKKESLEMPDFEMSF